MLESVKHQKQGANGNPVALPQGNGKNGNGAHGEPLSLFPDIVALPTTVVKRDGRVVAFDISRIENALAKCFASLGKKPGTPLPDLATQVVNIISVKFRQPTVEQVQDIVEMVLQAAGEYDAAKHYILYRAEHAKQRQERPIPDAVRRAFAEADSYFPTQLQKFQFYDKYSRFNYDLGRRETWIETVDRSVDYLAELSQNRLPSETYARLRRAILEMRAMPSMRLLAMAGPAARRNNIAIYNCSYQPVESIESFVEALIISMSGCGVGFSVERKYVENFPRIKRQTGKAPIRLAVDDSAEGWAEALRFGLQTWFEGGDVHFDLSGLRAAGAPLKTKGGRASGPEPFRMMLDFVRTRLLARQGSFLRPLDAHDMMCAVGNAAVSGGVRRTAMISLFDYDDDEMRLSKNGDFERENSQRWNANNSAVWPANGFTQQEFIRQFMEMVDSGRGEPGIFSRAAANALKPARRAEAEFGTNPCVTSDTWVMTEAGPRQVADLVGVDFAAVVDGQRHPAKGFWETGVKPVLKLKTKEGHTLRLTANHKVLAVPYLSRKTEAVDWVEAGALNIGDQIKLHNHREFQWEGDGTFDEGWLLGSLVGDGTFDQKLARLTFWGEHRAAMAEQAVNSIHASLKSRADLRGHDQLAHDRTTIASAGLRDLAADYGIHRGLKTITPFVEQASSAFYCGFLQGLFDADGTVIGTQTRGVSVRLAQSDSDLLRAAQRMLLRLGLASTLYENRRPAGVRQLPDGRGGYADYECRADHELVIANDNLAVFAELIGFSDPDKRERLQSRLDGYQRQMNRERFVATVESIEPDGEEVVYDCSVADVHAFDANGLFAHNCGEINLRPHEFCNLTAAVARVDDTFESLREKVEVATLIGTIQSMATHFPGLRPMWKQNCEDERLLGVDITGQMDSPIAQDARVKEQLRQVALDVNRAAAEQLGIRPSASITCVKPSGNSSQLLNCASGLHARWAPYYVRNVRVAAHSPVYKVLRDAGVPMDPENGQTADEANTWVIHFPVKAPEGAITRNARSAVEQCEYWLQNKVHWTEHNPSCFTGETRLITERGLMSFHELKDALAVDPTQMPRVLGKEGHWVEAAFQSLGEQEIWEVVVERCGIQRIIRTTENHLWPITSPMRRYRGSEFELRTTRELPINSKDYKLVTVNPQLPIPLDLEGVLHGITYGDGTQSSGYEGRTRYCSVALCNDPNGVDSRQLADLFIEAGYSPNVREDLSQIQFYGLPTHWKQLPGMDESPEYLRGFVAGWFAADGHISHTVTLSNVCRESLEWLQTMAPRAGLATPTTIAEYHSESGVAPVTYHVVALVKETLDDDFFVLNGKRERYAPAKFAKYWKVTSVRNTAQRMPVYCVQVVGAEPYFALEGNILTHNCTITYRPDEVLELMKWVWEHREQIGGLSFLPAFDANYAQMPYAEIAADEYQQLAAEFPNIDFAKLYYYEEDDLTTAAQELACLAGNCEVEIVPRA